MELTNISAEIESRIKMLTESRKILKERGEIKARAIADYDKAMAVTLLKMKNGVEMELDGVKFKSIPVSIMEKIAKGMCYNEKLKMEEATALYAAAVSGIESIRAELNGYQSIFRHLDEN